MPGFEITGWLGRGGFGRVYRARRLDDGRDVAIKIAHDTADAHARLARERDVLAALGPPYVPALLAAGTLAGGAPFLVLELIELPSLGERMARLDGPLPAPAATALIRPVIAALAELHDRGIVHRDVTPENLLVGEHAKLVDFGLARGDGDAAITGAGVAAGTAIYSAPEQLAGSREPTTAADVYALGVILYELATGRPPFFGSDAEVRVAHQAHRPRPPRELASMPEPFEAAILDCLAKDPARRPHTAALAARLDAAATGAGPASDGGGAGRARLPCAVLVFEAGPAGVAAIADTVARWHGELAGRSAELWAALFSPTDGARPLARARRAGDELVARGLAARAVVERRDVVVRRRRDGGHQIVTRVLDGARARLAGVAARRVVVAAADDHRAAAPATAITDEPSLVGRDAVIGELTTDALDALARGVARRITVLGPDGVGRTRLARRLAGELAARAPTARVILLGLREAGVGAGDDAVRQLAGELLRLATNGEPQAASANREPQAASANREPRAACREPSAASAYREPPAASACREPPAASACREPPAASASREPRAPSASREPPAASACREPRAPSASREPPAASASREPSAASASREPPADARALIGAEDRAAEIALAYTLGWPVADDEVAQLRATPGAHRAALSRALAALLRGAARRAPLALIVDDAQFAEVATLDALRLACAGSPAPLWLCALTRRPLWSDGDRAVALAALPAGPAGELCRELLRPAIDVPDAVIAELVDRARGIPRELIDAVRALHAAGAIRRRRHGGDCYLDTDALDDAITDGGLPRELAALDPALRNHAGVLALLAPGWSASDAAAITDRLQRAGRGAALPLDPGVALDRLHARGLIDGLPEDAPRFTSARLRDAAAAALGPELARHVHAAAAAHHEQLVAARPHDRRLLARLAPHVVAIGELARATAILLELADAVRDVHDYLPAEALYGRVIDLGGDAAIELRARRGRALMRYRLGRHEDAAVDYARTVELAGDPETAAELLLDQATALDWCGEAAASARCVSEARRALAGDPGSPALQVRLLVADGRRLWRGNELATAVDRLERAVAGGEPIGDPVYEDTMAAIVMLVFLLPSLDRLADAELLAARGIAICEQRGDRYHLTGLLNNRQLVSMRRGDHDRAIADLERAERIGHELGMPIQRYRTRLGLADIHRRLGRYAEARHHAELARAIERDGSAAGSQQQSASVVLVQLLALAGEPAAARELLAAIARDALGHEEPLVVRGMELALADRDDDAAWSILLDELTRSAAEYLPDLLEQRALAARRAVRLADARRHLEAAAAAARVHDPVALARLERWLAELASCEPAATSGAPARERSRDG